MFKRKFEDVDELFVKTKTKTKAKTSVTKTVGIEIPDFLEKEESAEDGWIRYVVILYGLVGMF